MYFFTFCSHSIIQDFLAHFFFFFDHHDSAHMYRNHLNRTKYCIPRTVIGDSIDTLQNKHNLYIRTPTTTHQREQHVFQ
jgi:hypothetical protein